MLLGFLWSAPATQAATLTLEDGASRQTFETAALLARPDATEVTIARDDSYGGAARSYRAVPLAALLSTFADAAPDGTLEAVAADGYTAQLPFAMVTPSDPQAFLAIEPTDAPWPALPGKPASAGPFYVVWKSVAQPEMPAQFWPYQVATLRYVPSPTTRWPQMAVDATLPADHPARAGEKVFVSVCITCHMVNGGGASDIGPDLNLPMNPVHYFQPAALRKLIRNSASVRTWPEQKMPALTAEQISDADIDAVIAYLGHIAELHPAPADAAGE